MNSTRSLMPSRKGYHKVRGGCLTCKERKVRCGLERPVCRNCSRLFRSCTYAKPVPGQETAQSPFDLQSKCVSEIELMHHYTAYTYLTLSDNPILVSLWKEVVPKHAFQHHFLLQGLLAVAAQHRLHDKSGISMDLINTANFYHHKALSNYINLLSDVTEENCHALFAFSQVIVAISYSRLSLGFYEETKLSHGLIASIVHIFELLKGALAIANQARTWLRAGDLGPMLRQTPKRQSSNPSAVHASCIEALSKLSDHIAGQIGNSDESRVRGGSLLSAIQLLHTLFLEDFESVDKLNKIVGLPVFLDKNYLSLMRARDDASLAILAYYGVALHQIRHVWSFDGIGAKIVQAVACLVSHDWSPYLIWPQMEINEGP
ncbi:hypothetical protein V1525DRAFT_398905 [Lipomyces kononenkoae]|uniref:Uncharacterized protein n=1 Tax=Lipomyces kononenkoae TaxID=34357 RepID=A0ACC3T5K0_LIPKO